MATISNTPRPGYVWDSTDNVWYPIGVGGHSHPDYITQATAISPTTVDAKGDLLVGSAADTISRLAVGADGSSIVADSSTATGLKWAAPATGMTNPMTTTGDTIYSSSGSTPARLGIGSTGQVLTVAGGVPTWATASAAAQTFTLISTTSLSGSTTTVSGLSGKNQYYFFINGASMSGAGQDLLLRFNSDSGSNYSYLWLQGNGTTFDGFDTSGNASQITLGQQGSNAADTMTAYIMLEGANSTAIKPVTVMSYASGSAKKSIIATGRYLGTSTISSVSVIAGSGTFDAGSILVYGA